MQLLPMCFPIGFMRLNKPTVAKLQMPAGKTDVIVFDDTLPGFGIRLRAGGKRTWIAQYRVGTKQRRIVLGNCEALDADAARARAREALARVHLGSDPQAEKVEKRQQASITLQVVAEQYLAGYAANRLKPRSLVEVERHLRSHWAPLGETGIDGLKRAMVSARLAEIAKNNGPFAANRARAALSAMYSWAIGEGLAHSNPVAGTHRATEEVSRDRVLTDEELTLVWQLAGPGDFGAIVRLLILVGSRREEVGAMTWSEITGDVWRIAAERSKNRHAHDVPLSPPALSILNALPRMVDRDLVFGSRDGPFSGWSASKAKLDERMLAALKERHGKAARLTPWRLHDLRRTAATRMIDIGVLPHIVEATLNHISGHRAGVAGVYNRAIYAAEKRAALALWGAHVEKLTR